MTTMFRCALTLILAAGGCGDDEVGSTPADAGPAQDGGGAPDGGVPGVTAFAVATDFFTAGVASTVSVPALEVTQNAVAGVASTDPVVRLHGDRLYIINRFGHDNVTILEADTLALVAQISTGGGSNPQDVAVFADRVYVATLAGPGVAVLDPADPDAGVVDTIDLGFLDAEDDTPNCHTLAARGQHLIVTCGVIDDATFEPRGAGRVAVIDLTSKQVTDVVPLAHPRPFGFGLLVPPDSAVGVDVLIPTVPSFTDPAAVGCVQSVTIDPADGTATVACLLDNEALGGYAAALAHDPADDRLWIAVTSGFDSDDFGPVGHLLRYDAAGGVLHDPAGEPEDRPMDVAVCGTGHLLVSQALRGVRVYQPGGAVELTRGALDLGLPPVSNGLVCP